MRRTGNFLVVLSLLLLALPVLAQEAPVYTYLAHWNVPRAQWAEFIEFGEENAFPVLERMLADGTIVAWGSTVAVVHEQGGTTHEVYWAASSIAGIERAREELTKLPWSSVLSGAKHHDHLLQSLIHRGSTTDTTTGSLYVNIAKVRPGRGQAWRAVWEKYFKPTYDELLDNGTILAYEVSIQYVHTEDPRYRYVWYIAPSADAVDKVHEAYTAVFEKEAPAIFAALSAVAIRSEHRDVFRRVLNYAHK